MNRIRISLDAEVDLDSIAAFISLDNPYRAESFTEEISARILDIAERPLSFPAREEIFPGLRSALHGKYLIFFRLQGDVVEVLRIVHGARDLKSLLGGE